MFPKACKNKNCTFNTPDAKGRCAASYSDFELAGCPYSSTQKELKALKKANKQLIRNAKMTKKLEKVRNINTCGGCGTTGDLVECGGIYNCPNPFCLATGAWNLRLERGYQDEEGGQTDDQLQRMLADLMKEINHLNGRLKILEGCRKRIRDRMDS